MVSGDEGAKEVTGTNPIWPTGPAATVTGLAVNLAVAPEAPEGSEAPLLVDPADTDDEKARRDAFQLIMQGFHATTRTLSDHYQLACKEVEYCTEVQEEVHCDGLYICVGGLGHHTLMGVGRTASHELYGREFGGAGTTC